jgi:hypothetical protein
VIWHHSLASLFNYLDQLVLASLHIRTTACTQSVRVCKLLHFLRAPDNEETETNCCGQVKWEGGGFEPFDWVWQIVSSKTTIWRSSRRT